MIVVVGLDDPEVIDAVTPLGNRWPLLTLFCFLSLLSAVFPFLPVVLMRLVKLSLQITITGVINHNGLSKTPSLTSPPPWPARGFTPARFTIKLGSHDPVRLSSGSPG